MHLKTGLLFIVWLVAGVMSGPGLAKNHLIIVSGLGGEPQFQNAFDGQALAIYRAAETLNADATELHLLTGEQANTAHLLATLERLQLADSDQLQLHLIGHGSWDGRQYKFNLLGPDLTATQLAQALDRVGGQQLVALMTSSSGAAMEQLAGDNRVVITATKSGLQKNLSQFSRYWAEGVSSELADLNKNETIDLNELYQFTQSQVSAHYEESALIASEASLLQGDNLERFIVARVGLLATGRLDAQTEALLAERDALEAELDELALRRDQLGEAEYFDALQRIILQLGQIQNRIDMRLTIDNEGALE